jgi:hypothetical protein
MVKEHYSDEVITAWVERIHKYHAVGATPQQQIETGIRQAVSGMDTILSKKLVAKDAEIATLRAEYRALWDTAVALMNTPGTFHSEAEVEAYAALITQAMKSRFWNEAT